MPVLQIPVDRALDRRLAELARAEDRTPVRQARVLLRRALGLPDAPAPEPEPEADQPSEGVPA